MTAFLRVYGARSDWPRVLREKFFVASSTVYSDEQFVEHAAELSVAHHIALGEPAEFEIGKKMDPQAHDRDVDVFFLRGQTRVAIEVKCPQEQARDPDQPTLVFAGRHPERDRMARELAAAFAGANLPAKLKTLQLAQHKDTKLKDFLVSAHHKFSVPDFDQLNILLVAAGEDLLPWYHYLHEREGLFTPQSFHPPRQYARTQVVMLSNLKYFHTQAAAHHDWTLKNVFLLPFFNPAADRLPVMETRTAGLEPFDHHFRAFQAFSAKNKDPNVPDYVEQAVRLGGYIHQGLSDAEFSRFFPGSVRRGAKPGPKA